MRSSPFHVPGLGDLTLVEMYEYYDGPKLFACANPNGSIYLCLWVGIEQDFESYWMVFTSLARFQILRSGGLPLARAFLEPESGVVLACKYVFESNTVEVEYLPSGKLDRSLLPQPQEVLDLPTETMPIRLSELALSQKAFASKREHLGLHLNFRDFKREEAPTKDLGKLLFSMQEIIESLAQGIDGTATSRGMIAPSVSRAAETRVVYAGGGSFALEISAAEAVNLFGESLIGSAIASFVELIETGNDVKKLRTKLIAIESRATSKYRIFLSSLVSAETGIRIDWASPEPSKNKTVTLSLSSAASALQTVQTVTSEMGELRIASGCFVGLQLLGSSTFTAVFANDEHVYRGRILDSARAEADHATMNKFYKLSIRERLDISVAGEEKVRYELEKIEPIHSSDQDSNDERPD